MAGDKIALAFTIEAQGRDDLPAVEDLLDRAFGADRHERTAYRLRDGVPALADLSLVARADGKILGTIRFWPIILKPEPGARADGAAAVPALLLGPLAVEPALKGQGVGIALMREGLARATQAGHGAVILVGDYNYYHRVGFGRTKPGQFTMPGAFDPARLLSLELIPGALATATGRIRSVAEVD